MGGRPSNHLRLSKRCHEDRGSRYFNLPGPIHLPQATGLTLLEQDLESALAAIPSGHGEGVYEGLRCGVTLRGSLATESGPACSRERSRAATSAPSTFTWRTQVGHLPRSEKCRLCCKSPKLPGDKI